MHYSTKYYSLFQKYGLDKLLRSHGNFNLLAPVNDALKKTTSRKVMSCHLLSQAVCHFVIIMVLLKLWKINAANPSNQKSWSKLENAYKVPILMLWLPDNEAYTWFWQQQWFTLDIPLKINLK